MLPSAGQGVSRASPAMLCRAPWARLAGSAASRAASAAGGAVSHVSHSSPPGLWAAARQQRKAAAAAAAAEQQQAEDDWNIDTAGGRQEHQRTDIEVVLVHPQIPQNSGNIARTCAATNVPLHLVGPLGFELDSKKLKRAGLDYWPKVCVEVHPSWEAFMDFWQQQPGPKQLVGYTKFAKQHYAADGLYPRGTNTWLLFGAETTGLPDAAHAAATHLAKIPMSEAYVRSLNLATSAGIGVMEVLRQKDGAILPEDM